MNIKYVFWGFCVLMAFPLSGFGQKLQDSTITARPIPYPVFQSKHFQQAVINQTRTKEGLPGKNYWTNKAAYRIQATLAPETKILQASGELEYFNHSSDTLYQLVLKVRQNLHQEGAVRNRSVDITGGVTFTRVAVDGRVLLSRNRRYKSGYTIIGTVMYVDLKEPLFPGETAFLEFDWQFKVPEPKNPRMGQDGEVYFLGYWYPQFAVYDDVMGWDDEPYLGNGEFYMDFADYDVKLTVPEGWIVAATGQLQNSEEILNRDVIRRLEKAKESDKVVTVVDREDQFPGKSTLESENGLLTWHYIAKNCRDFAFGASERFIWQAVRAKTNHNQNTLIQTFYRWGTSSWDKAALYGQFSVEYLSKNLSVYPYPQISIVEGIIPGGMEYPMITLIGGRRSEFTLFAVIFHEIAHLWFPMLVSSDEKTFTWMDEGLVTYYTNIGKDTYFEKFKSWSLELDRYIHFAKTGMEVEVSRHADRFPVYGLARRVAGYGKPAIMLRSLKAVIGEETFNKAIKDYIRSWQYRHPYPYDFFNIIEAHYGKDLDWFWTPFIYETWQLDQALTRVDETPTEITIAIEDKGLIPLPVFLRLTDSLKQHRFVRLPVDGWLSGKRQIEVTLPGSGYQRVDIDPERYFPDIDTTNNSWIKP
jgi:hypothetical protein